MNIIGVTVDGKQVVDGIGKFYFEQGLPLVFIFDTLTKNKMIPSWVHLVSDLKNNGMSSERIHRLLNEHVFESYGKEFRDHIISTLKKTNAL